MVPSQLCIKQIFDFCAKRCFFDKISEMIAFVLSKFFDLCTKRVELGVPQPYYTFVVQKGCFLAFRNRITPFCLYKKVDLGVPQSYYTFFCTRRVDLGVPQSHFRRSAIVLHFLLCRKVGFRRSAIELHFFVQEGYFLTK